MGWLVDIADPSPTRNSRYLRCESEAGLLKHQVSKILHISIATSIAKMVSCTIYNFEKLVVSAKVGCKLKLFVRDGRVQYDIFSRIFDRFDRRLSLIRLVYHHHFHHLSGDRGRKWSLLGRHSRFHPLRKRFRSYAHRKRGRLNTR